MQVQSLYDERLGDALVGKACCGWTPREGVSSVTAECSLLVASRSSIDCSSSPGAA